MYQPKLEDVRFSNYVKPSGAKYGKLDGKLVAHAIIYLADPSGKHFGYRKSIVLPVDASKEQKKAALKEAADTLLAKFDVETAAKNQEFTGDLSQIKPYYEFSERDQVHTLEEAIAKL